MRRYCRIRSFLLAGLLAFVIPPSSARAVSISLVPDGSTTIEIGETVNVDVFLVLDAADQVAGIDAVTLHLELGSPFVDVVGSSSGSVFPVAVVNVYAPKDFIAFAQFGVTVTSPTALLGSLSITGRAQGAYALVGRRFANFPLFTAPGVPPPVNRYDFASNEALVITVTCGAGACPIADPVPTEPTPPPPPPVVPDLPPEEPPEIAEPPADDPPPEILGPPATPPVILTIMTILTTFTSTDTGTLASTPFGTLISTTQVVPEPHTFALLGLALTGLILLRSSRRKPPKQSPGS